MGRYTDSVCRQCRREGEKLFLKGDRCYSVKCAVEKRPFVPGQHGQKRRQKTSEYGLQLREKQKTKRIYGVSEKQFRNTFEKADRQQGVTGDNLLALLERRLDNVVFRMGMASSRKEARQLVNHDHFTINGKKANIPSMLVKAGDVIQVKEASAESPKFEELKAAAAYKTAPEWLEVNADSLTGRVLSLPTRDQIDTAVSEHLIVELYSR
ncbi:Ribosomal protein S4, bacterial-type [Syntrophomonas zehnderi OL-4]|uniref:Small ribosomal subunit protein uS4 n=1 Tax=Syntrophomonas zehnderi OL-4 TaxID=690567 RepID=A0A0E4G940_9FIRM|nr:30S ribosomal protein S4 [Syntrophomonas zehnderi]CFX05358.1 Ribosomal protein S4, bacterial-type [Syntrophomonas zehnderi OL-4]CFX34877.1 Ribosomal protein S4, bacterial-type [Syntrophomonas zehnderi OL-4]